MNNVKIRSFGLLIFVFLFAKQAKCQDTSAVHFYDIVRDDSVVMYFDKSYNYTEKSCAVFQRHCRIDSNGEFYGAFTDVDTNENLLGKGFYQQQMKHGYFETYHPGGHVKSKGNFKNNRPAGYWYYYYPDGKPERTLLFNLADTLMIEFYDLMGNHTVSAGNGRFSGFVGSSLDLFYSTLILAEGDIVNGKPNGEWITRLAGYHYCTEYYTAGVFTSGKITKRFEQIKEDYSDFSFLIIIYMPSYQYRLEEFQISKCMESFISKLAGNMKKEKVEKIDYNLDNFRSYLNDALSRVIDNEIRNGNFADYPNGDNLIKIAFTVNSQGVPVDFKKVTSWGDAFYNDVTSVLSNHAKLPPSTQKRYLELTIVKGIGNLSNYRYRFSNE